MLNSTILILLNILGYFSFSWAVFKFFTQGNEKNNGMFLIKSLGTIFFGLITLAYVFFIEYGSFVFVSVVFYFLSISMFWWTVKSLRGFKLELAYSGKHSNEIITTGPYSIVRHPFYTSYILFWIAPFFYFFTWWSLLPTAVMFIFYHIAASKEESFYLSNPVLGVFYKEYKEKTGRFFPSL